jgi:hypothetical protein
MTTKVLEAMKAAELAHSPIANQARRVLLVVEQLPDELRPRVQKFYNDLGNALGEFGKAGLKVGQILNEARALLKPLGIWFAFLNRIPGMSAKTGDRFIKRYEMAQKQLSETIISIAIATGMQIAGESEKEPYGKYTKAVQKVGPPPKDTEDKEKNLEKARVWVARVNVTYAKQVQLRRARAKQVDPTEKASDALVRQARAYVEDKQGQIEFLQRVLKRTLKELGYAELLTVQSEAGKTRKAA